MTETDEAMAMVDHIAEHPETALAEAIGGLTAAGHVVDVVEEGWEYRLDGRRLSAGDLFVAALGEGLIASAFKCQ